MTNENSELDFMGDFKPDRDDPGCSSTPRQTDCRSFGQLLKSIRTSKALSLRDAAELIGVEHTQLLRWERQEQAPKMATVERIARGLGCTASELFAAGDENVTAPSSPDRGGVMDPQVKKLRAKVAASEKELERLGELILEFVDAYAVPDRVATAAEQKDRKSHAWQALRMEAQKARTRELHAPFKGFEVDD